MSRPSAATRLRACLVTGPAARFVAFAIDFTVLVARSLRLALHGLTRR